jgi:ABC-2 type transport system ATP-binding protein
MTIFEGIRISKYFPNSNFRLEIPELVLGENSITGVVGENGNGKTTLLDIIAGESKGTGEFKYFNNVVDSSTDWLKIKDYIGFIPQRIPRWYGTLEENLFLKARLSGIATQEIDHRVDEMLDFLDLNEYRTLKWTEISTGYRLRFELARILLGSPKLLVLDEPLANLDINTQQKFLSDLRDLVSVKDEKMAIIISSQQLHEIESVATQMVFLKKGQMIFSGESDKIAASSDQSVIELMVIEKDREKTQQLFTNNDIHFSARGPYLQLESALKPNDVLQLLIHDKIEIIYFRDLTRSTKRFFN